MQAERRKNAVSAAYIITAVLAFCVVSGLVYSAWKYNIIPHGKYPSSRFGIETYISDSDADGDGIDDQTDILLSVKAYLATKPKYKSAYYDGGYPNDGYGVCTDVVAQGMLGAGYDLMELVAADIAANPGEYAIEKPDKNIDFRRVVNLLVYFRRTAKTLTTDVGDISEWQGGDIVVFPHHIGIISDNRNYRGVPFVLHHANPTQKNYEEDILQRYEILGHFRLK